MATAELLIAIVGSPMDSEVVRMLIDADGLVAWTEPDSEEGETPDTFLSGQPSGYLLVHDGQRVTTAFMYAEPADGYASFAGPLPYGLPSGSTRTQVRNRFGSPERSGEAATMHPLGQQGAWDRFVMGGLRIHFQYSEPHELVCLVTVMTADAAP